jgi:hypothetical protein
MDGSDFKCVGCGEIVNYGEVAVIETSVLLACTPLCLYDGVRKWIEADDSGHKVDYALLTSTSRDLALALADFLEEDTLSMDWEVKKKIIAAWKRLEYVSGVLELSAEAPAIDLDPRV